MPTPSQINAFFEFSARQLSHLLDAYPDRFPMYTTAGKWDVNGESWTNWCEGFLCGQLWLLYQHTQQPVWRERAEHYCRLIEPRKNDRSVHDLGFLFWPSWKRWYDLTGDPALNEVVIQAGKTLALRYQARGRYLCSFLGPNSLFIDIMMNVGIIFYAANQLGDLNLETIARQHCSTTRKYLVRGDGSTAHEGIFDPETGQFLQQSTQQGWRADSAWARGLAWAVYGFSSAYEMTGDHHFLATAELCAGYYLEHTPHHGVPPNDWDEPHPATPYESSAAAIAASGLLDLARLCPDAGRAETYRQASLGILDTLCLPEFLAVATPGWEGLLKHGIYHQRKGLGVDQSVMWGDYFLMEAMSKLSHAQ
jgi:unsaturated chondroitin disaccharide hydrolase